MRSDRRIRRPALISCLYACAFACAAWVGCDFSAPGADPGTGPDTAAVRGTPLALSIPGFPEMPVPKDNPTTVEGARLGRMLFHDPILSRDSTQSCASCHGRDAAFTDAGKPLSLGVQGLPGTVNAQSIVNPGWNTSYFWNGRAATLEDQAFQPVRNPVEMDLPWDLAQARLNAHPVYAELFAEVFGPGAIDSVKVVKALAQFERTFLSFGSKYDKVQRGEAQYTDSERRGFALFMTEKGDCFHCHGPPRFGDDVFRNNGLDTLDPAARTGRSEVTGRVGDAAKWKTPTLRNVAASAPYMHDGRFATLEEVMDHYDKGIIPGPTVDPLLLGHRARSGELLLTEQDKADLISFLNCLTDSAFLGNPEFGPP